MYQTKEGVDVTKFIEEGRTKVFDTETEAYQYARKTNSYHYPIYKEDENKKKTLAGFGVPK